MPGLRVLSWQLAVVTRWVALIAGSLVFLFFLAFLVGEGPPNILRLTTPEKFTFLAVLSLFFGLAVAWKWESWGGLISLAGFALLIAIDRRGHLGNWAFAVPAIIGAVHIACWGRLQAGAPPGVQPGHLSRNTILTASAVIGIFLLLCANEMFGQPPLMSPSPQTWTTVDQTWLSASDGVALIIHPDGSVGGALRQGQLTNGRLTADRSWFGRLMGWRYDYLVRGEVPGENVWIRMVRKGPELTGWIWVIPSNVRDDNSYRPSRIVLRRQ